MVASVVDYNPRQLKRFINNVIIAFETFTNPTDASAIKFNEIFLVKILKAEWPDFYKELSHKRIDSIREEIRELVKYLENTGRQPIYTNIEDSEVDVEFSTSDGTRIWNFYPDYVDYILSGGVLNPYWYKN